MVGTNALNDQRYPPSKVLPFYGYSFYCAPLCFLFHDPVLLFVIYKKIYLRKFSKFCFKFIQGCYSQQKFDFCICSDFVEFLQPTQNPFKMASFKFRVVLCRIRVFPTLISKIKWFRSGVQTLDYP